MKKLMQMRLNIMSPAFVLSPATSPPHGQTPQRAAYPIVLLFSALALVIVLLGWGIYAQQAQRFREQENAKLIAIAELKAHQIGNWLAERTSNAEVLQGGDLQAEVLNHWLATGDAAEQ